MARIWLSAPLGHGFRIGVSVGLRGSWARMNPTAKVLVKWFSAMFLVFLALTILAQKAKAEDAPWGNVSHQKCSEMVTSSGHFTAKTPAMLVWLGGYIDGISAPARLDKRLKTIGDAGSEQIGPLVLVFCRNKQDETLITATASVAEMLINAQSGRVLNLQNN